MGATKLVSIGELKQQYTSDVEVRITKGDKPGFLVYVDLVTCREGSKKIHSQTIGGGGCMKYMKTLEGS